MPVRGKGFFADDEMENLRLGTRDQWESEWTVINDGETHSFTHTLGEIPWMVDVLYSEQTAGGQARDGNASVTITKTATTITCLSNFSAGIVYYFKVRAM